MAIFFSFKLFNLLAAHNIGRQINATNRQNVRRAGTNFIFSNIVEFELIRMLFALE